MAKQEREVRVAHEHLNPALQFLIQRGEKGGFAEILDGFTAVPSYPPNSIKALRTTQKISAGALVANVALDSYLKSHPHLPAFIGTGLASMSREAAGSLLRNKHKELVTIMRSGGVLKTKYEGHYPEGWMNPTTIAQTHPIFHVDPKTGDLIFHKETRGEYFKWQVQRKVPTSIGWWWREYLRPPTAPQSVKAWANDKLAAWKLKRRIQKAREWRPREIPKGSPGQVPLRVRSRS